jgi:histidinol-phosphate aminotransferase
MWNRYPDGSGMPLLKQIAAYTGHDPQGIVIGNGSNEIIQAVFSASCAAGDSAVMVHPGFAVYPRVAAVLGVRAVQVPLLPSFEVDIPALLKAAGSARLVIIATPNVPTGIAMRMDTIEKIASHTAGLIAIDEAYFEFNECTAQALLRKYDSMVVIRTLSKACSLAGARLGYALASPALAEGIEKAKLPFSVGIFQHVAGEILLRDRTFIKETVDRVIEERAYVYRTLTAIPGITPVPTQANFILMNVAKKSAQDVYNMLYKKGVLVRHFNTPELRDTLRVTIGTHDENEIFIETLRSIMAQDERS